MKNGEIIILSVDDNQNALNAIEALFADQYKIISCISGEDAISIARERSDIDIVIMDIKMPGIDGVTAASEIKKILPSVLVIFHTGFPGEFDEDQIDSNEKPFDYVQKGGPVSRLRRSVKNAAELILSKTKAIQTEIYENTGMITNSPKMIQIYRLLNKISDTDSKVTILGESGTGKELLAKAIHYNSKRASKPFLVFHCNHKDKDLVESQLFGHVKGAYTGAVSDRIGIFEEADGGTVFLDEIGDLDGTSQGKLLRVLEQCTFTRMGENKERQVDVRVVCATNKDLKQLIEEEKFRKDLYYRLNGFVISLPSLRERKEDIPFLIEYFTSLIVEKYDLPMKYYESEARDFLVKFDWEDGNIRWLKNCIEALITIADSDLITLDDVIHVLKVKDSSIHKIQQNESLASKVKDFKRTVIIDTLKNSKGNKAEAARILKIDPSNFHKLLENLDITPDDYDGE
jgi:DNA-binding NtrC family response regulator